ncbi:MAG TPA: lipopolysaccharide biosynthesis protein [Flavobacterium sp.]|jgi:O-antigen/teichoic acid export membrane protein
MSELRKKTLNGLAWTFAQQFGVQFLNFGVSILLARILLPAEFGLLGMIAIFIAIGNSLVDSGMGSSLIRTTNPDDIDYSTVFFTNLLFSVAAYAVIFFTAPFIAAFFGQPVLTDLVRVYCLTFIIAAFSTVQSTKLNKEMRFKTQMMINIPSLIAGAILGIFLAYRGFGVWSLVYMNLCQVFVATVQLWLYSKWKPRLVFDRKRFRKHFMFGYKLAVSGMMNSIVKNLYNILIGRFFSAAQLGFYIRAKSMQELPVINISNALNKVTYPMFASISDDDDKLRSIYRRMMQLIFFVIAPLMFLAIVIAEPLFRFLLTEKWLPAVPYFQILCLAGIVTPLNSYNLNILLVKGRSDRFLKLEFVKNAMTVAGVFIAIPFGMQGLLWSVAAIALVTFFINAYFCGKILSITLVRQILDIFPMLVLAFACGVATYYIDLAALNWVENDLLHIIFVSLMYGMLYIGMSVALRISALSNLKSLIFRSGKKG